MMFSTIPKMKMPDDQRGEKLLDENSDVRDMSRAVSAESDNQLKPFRDAHSLVSPP
jgi:hypothetical protein